MDLYEMLKASLHVYLKNLDCITGIVYQVKPSARGEFNAEMIFSIPYALVAKNTYSEIEQLVPAYLTESNLSSFRESLPLNGKCKGDQFFHIMRMGDFGFLVLIRKNSFIEANLLESLEEINNKLASRSFACVENESLRESQLRYKYQQELLPEMLCEVTLKGDLIFANNYAIEKVGYTADEMKKGFNILQIIHPDDHQKFQRNLSRSLSEDKLPAREYQVLKKDGTTFPSLVYTNRLIKNGVITGLIGVMVDITEIKTNEKKLKLYTERLELALLGSDAGLWDWNIKTDHVYFSERWCRMLGYNPSEVQPDFSTWEMIIHPEDRSGVLEILNKHLEKKIPLYRAEHRVKTKKGEWKWILNTGKVTERDETGNPLRAVGTNIDITERKETEELNRIEQELSIKLASSKSLDQTLKICLESAIKYPQMDCGGIYIEDETDGSFRLIKQLGLSDEFLKSASVYPGDSGNSAIIRKGKPVYSLHQDLIQNNDNLLNEELKAISILPILYMNRSIGCLNIASRSLVIIPEVSRKILEKIALHIGSFIIQSRNEDKLHQNQQDLNTLFDTIDDFLFILDMEGKIIYTNSTVKDRLGYKEKELLSKHVLFLHPSDQYEEAKNKIEGMLLGTIEVCRVPLLTRNGVEIPVETKVKKGTWCGKDALIGISRDTTERKRYEKQIRVNIERLEMALLASDAGLWDWNLKTEELILNEKWFSLRGFEQEENINTVEIWKKLLHPDDLEPTLRLLDDHLEGKTQFYQSEYRSKTKSGKYIWVLDTGKIMEYDDEGKPLRVIGTNIDITAKKENEISLQKNLRQQEILSEIALELNSLDDFDVRINTVLSQIGTHSDVSRVYIFEDSSDGLVTSNTYEWCNKNILPQLNDLQGIPYEMIPSWKPFLLEKGRVYSENISELPDDLRAILEPQEIKSIVVYPLYIQGAFFGFVGFDECSKSRSWSKSELELLRTISGIIANAYERKIMEQSIITERDKANNANRAKSEFLANMSHEIRTPMNAVLGFSEALYHKLDSDQHRKMLQSVLSSGNLLLSLLNDILDLSKIEAGKLEITPQPTDLKNIIEEIKLLFDDKASKKGIEINIFISPEFPAVLMLDEIRIKQVIFNLVGNAVKFTHEGFVNLKVEFEYNSADSGNLIIDVEDSGIGIAESQQKAIFEAFRQQSGQSNRMYGGIGLGLAISKRLVEKMMGDITVSSEERKGSLFRVKLPDIKINSSKFIKQRSFENNQDIVFEKANILVIDDVASNVESIEHLLYDKGLNIFSAENGEASLEILKTKIPDLILLDIRMPGISGFDVAKILKSDPRLSHIPVIAFTASVFGVEKIEHSGVFDGYLLKPVNRSDLFSQIARFLKHKTIAINKVPGKTDLFYLENLPEDLVKSLPIIVESLRINYLPKWEKINGKLILYKIEEFAIDLKKMAVSHSFHFLAGYADKIIEELDMVDLEALKETLSEFPRIIEKISSEIIP